MEDTPSGQAGGEGGVQPTRPLTGTQALASSTANLVTTATPSHHQLPAQPLRISAPTLESSGPRFHTLGCHNSECPRGFHQPKSSRGTRRCCSPEWRQRAPHQLLPPARCCSLCLEGYQGLPCPPARTIAPRQHGARRTCEGCGQPQGCAPTPNAQSPISLSKHTLLHTHLLECDQVAPGCRCSA